MPLAPYPAMRRGSRAGRGAEDGTRTRDPHLGKAMPTPAPRIRLPVRAGHRLGSPSPQSSSCRRPRACGSENSPKRCARIVFAKRPAPKQEGRSESALRRSTVRLARTTLAAVAQRVVWSKWTRRSRPLTMPLDPAQSRVAILCTRPSTWWTNTSLGGCSVAIPVVCSIAELRMKVEVLSTPPALQDPSSWLITRKK
jgi:hypothetical protein